MKKFLPCVLIICLLLTGCNKTMNKHDEIKDVDFAWNLIGLVSTQGNCYITGDVSDKKNYGLDKIPSKWFQSDDYLCIYDHGDAEKISLSPKGGTIVNNMNEVYVFLNGSQNYRVPTVLLKGYIQAYLMDNDHVYLLSKSGDLGYSSIDNPSDFRLIGTNVKKFIVTVKEVNTKHSVFALTNDNRLYIFYDDEVITDTTDCLEGIIDFDLLVPHTRMCVLSLIDQESKSYMRFGDIPLTFDSFKDMNEYIKCCDNTIAVASYCNGTATLDSDGNVRIYGSEIESDYNKTFEYYGDILFSNAKGIYGGYFNLIVSFADGHFECFGRNYNKDQYISFKR